MDGYLLVIIGLIVLTILAILHARIFADSSSATEGGSAKPNNSADSDNPIDGADFTLLE